MMRLGYDGHGLNDLDDKYASRVLTFAKHPERDGGGYTFAHVEDRAAIAKPIEALPDLVKALQDILQSAGYTSGEALPTLTELRVHRKALDVARAALIKAGVTL